MLKSKWFSFLLAASTAGAVLSTAPSAQAADVRIGGFAGFFQRVDLDSQTLQYSMDEVKLVPIVDFNEQLGFVSEFVYDYHRTADPLGAAKGSAVPLKMEQVILNYYGVMPGLNMTVGQMRIPYGFWDDLSAERKSSRIKNNKGVLGFALRKRDMGVQLFGGSPQDMFSYKVAVVNGNGENVPSDSNTSKDVIGRFAANFGGLHLGLSGYVASPGDAIVKTSSYGVDYMWEATDALTLSGEAALNSNNRAGGKDQLGEGKGAYVQANYNMYEYLPGLRLFAMYDWYQENIASVAAPVQTKIIGGFRYRLSPGATWIINASRDDDGVKPSNDFIGKLELNF